jgi:hypothetical protein
MVKERMRKRGCSGCVERVLIEITDKLCSG